ncbi:Phosphoribosylformylglycinamidine synthase, synthetase subunit (EC / Phosphoribosylformylglycinamidine synthase, glutamine amidotransferase subunit (EC [Lentimonas sp. CC19]|nr:Phosphoribosylformylglycinamidine synthase, synthetase subunit (EC / Phosphoribosylformylglycinamidine synthase, glutamine amidotransferase subunit (EC [Lentimonas sp. CC4]CAA6685470.1 Phosphoribosylformylglycinamidine synthase, synthetase subunit (EC / Phosphoribosylformylglycinamidine synthase, glutamine amidotransferase subunit (EC [Lentimonas sp. CC6]CAA6690545.1 Phosphoribosylformylglycinamidine synthase, synthetase subunit (EC / Phosphoribosylformylglycinamidine synthase, glutamine amido
MLDVRRSTFKVPLFFFFTAMQPIILQGRPAFSDFRLTALQAALNAAAPELAISQIDAVEAYFIESDNPLSDETNERAFALLAADRHFDREGGFFVTPRKGTISPWSTKATDIFHNCSIEGIARVERGIHFRLVGADGLVLTMDNLGLALLALHDRMTEAVYNDVSDFFAHFEPSELRTVPLMAEGPESFRKANIDWGLAMSPPEIDYLVAAYQKMERDPTDAELVMFSQVNSEHCRHKIFNADWIVDGDKSELSLFSMIRNTHKLAPEGTLSAYSDNCGVIEGSPAAWFEVNQRGEQRNYRHTEAQLDILCKVETHNHPTAISPFPGAATGVGGEIRDEGATGIGGRPKAGLSGFMVSNLEVPGYPLPWEKHIAEHPARLASPMDIMLEGPIGGASFGNEFGRPQLCGMFRTLQLEHNDRHRGYHKPIMVAGGMGNLKREHVLKKEIPPTALIIQLGGPAMKIGLGGGAASSIAAGAQSEALDFDSVQRGNPEMERRCQQVIDGCIALGDENPMLSIHDIGAGGLSNGLPELVEKTGGKFHLRNIHNEDSSMSPMEIWCNESQERYVMGVMPDRIEEFKSICERERCPVAVVGEATNDDQLVLEDSHFENNPIDMEMSVLLGKTPKMLKDVKRKVEDHAELDVSEIQLPDAIDRVLRFPAVANKTFLITIADRSITGMVTRDQMVGPWQTPVADVAVTSTSMDTYTGEAMAIGERTPMAILNAPASGRIAIGECLTNLAASNVGKIGNIKLSANWMVAAGEDGEDANLYDTVKTVGMEICPALGISIPVGKDSMSMRTSWKDSSGKDQKQVSPLSLMVTGFSSVEDVRKTVTPDLKSDNSALLLLDLGAGKNRLGGSTLAQVYNQIGKETPDLDDPEKFLGFFAAIQEMLANDLILSYHDRGDGGLIATLAEMSFAGRKGMSVILDLLVASSQTPSALNILFAEELGAVIEIDKAKISTVMAVLAKHNVSDITRLIGNTTSDDTLSIAFNNETIYSESITTLNRAWSELTYHMQAQRDNPACAQEEHEALLDQEASKTIVKPTFSTAELDEFLIRNSKFVIQGENRPKMAVFREQGINGQNEMAFAFDKAGFLPIDVHMTDLLAGRVDLKDFAGLVACGGFSYGDVLGAGSGWAKSVLYNAKLQDMFAAFFARDDSFTLGVCNGCQMISQLKDIIPGAENWPAFTRNRSEQFEGRYSNLEITKSPSIFFQGMEGSILPIPVAHGEGFANFSATGDLNAIKAGNQLSLRYVNGKAEPTELYPANPNGSPEGATGFTTTDGRATIMMPHPERCFRAVQMSYKPNDVFTGEAGPWLKMFQNARNYVG